MGRVAVIGAATAAVLLAGAAAMPPRAGQVSDPRWRPERDTIAGAFHVHTNRSDGAASVDEVAAAAARAGLRFVVLTDHGDGTRAPDPPAYKFGVLVVDGVEISTSGGHYTAVGMPASPYPLAGDAHGVIEDVARLGGFGVVSHPDSPKADLRWADRSADVDAFEWLNLDTVWRQATGGQIARAMIGYWFRRPETLALPMARPAELLDWLDATARLRRVVLLAATDAHGSLASSYDACFRTMTMRVELPAPLRGQPSDDARALVASLRAGHHYSVLNAVAGPAAFEFVGHRAGTVVHQGDATAAGTPLRLESRVAGPPGTMLALFRNGEVVVETLGSEIAYEADGRPGVFRIEARLVTGQNAIPFIVSNPIFVGLPADNVDVPTAAVAVVDLIAPGVQSVVWHTEHDRSSVAAQAGGSLAPSALGLRFALGGGPPGDQFAALVLPVPPDFATYDRLSLCAHASLPLRLSVQLRELGNQNPPRWRRSVYLDPTQRCTIVNFDDMMPVSPNAAAAIPRDRVGGLLLVVDTTNTAPGTSGSVAFSRLGLEASPR